MKVTQKGRVKHIVIFFVILVSVIGVITYKNNLTQKEVTVSQPTLKQKTEGTQMGDPVELSQSPIVSRPLNISSWKNTSFSLSRYDYTKFYEFNLVFKIPSNWKVEEKNKKTTKTEAGDYGYLIADYVISNPENTLIMNFDAIARGIAGKYPLPQDANLVATFVPSPSGGSAQAWIVRHTTNRTSPTKIRYAEALTRKGVDKLTTTTVVTDWISLVTNPWDSHRGGATYTIEVTYSGTDKDYGINISTADQIVSLIAAVDRN